jgi:outer membrane lipoprotein carrier protein
VTFSFANLDMKNLKTFEANFEQSIKSNSGNEISYLGNVFIKNSGKILWEYKTPIEKNVYVLNNFVIIDEPELEQAIYTTLENEINIIDLIKGSKKVDENTFLASIDEIKYFISLEKGKINTISYTDKLDNKVLISFNAVKQNENISDDVFKFDIPDYYDIIRK